MYRRCERALAVNLVDPILLVVLFLFGLRGYFKGLFREIFSLAGLITGFVMAVRYDEALAAVAESYWKISPIVLKGAAFVAVFFVVYFLFSLIGWLLHHSQKLLFLHTINRIGGIAVGIGKGTAFAALVVFVIASTSWIPVTARKHFQDSYLVPPLSRLAEVMIRLGREKLFLNNAGQAQLDFRFAL
jgi:membrane protein required for colicin V production